MLEFKKYLKPYKKQMILGPLAKLTEAVFDLIIPLFMASLMDVGIQNGDMNYIIKMSIYMGITSIVGLACAMYCQYSASIAAQGFGTELRNEVFKKISSFSHREIDNFGSASLVNRATTDIYQMQTAVNMFIRLVVRAPFLAIGGVIMAMMIDIKLSLVLLAFIPIFVLILFIILKSTLPKYSRIQEKLDKISLVVRENLTGIRVIRAFSRSDQEKKRFDNSNDEWMDISIKASKISSLMSPLTLLIMNIATFFIISYGGKRVYTGNLTQGELIAFINYITQILLALIVVSNLTILFNRAYASSKRVSEIMKVEPDVKEPNSPIEFNSTSPLSLEFKNVNFSYFDGDNALSNINFKIEEGKSLGIIGGTGSGKTTLVNLIPRFYNISSGEIKINEININQYSLKSLRENISYVPQKAQLYTGTVESNIRWGKPDASMEEIERAAEISQAKEFIERNPKKYDMEISQNGRNLSGGQRQRLTIARALVKNSKIIILDDSSSALDYVTDFKLRRAINNYNHGINIIVSQRVNSVKDCDQILVLDDGNMVAIGSHIDLYSSNDLYKKICNSQKIYEEDIA